MTLWTLIWRTTRYHLRSHIGTLTGAAVACAVLTGALLVGDSVRGSLREMALQRLGRVHQAIAGGDRTFRSALAEEISKAGNGQTTALLQLPATSVNSEGSRRANRTQVIGVNESFWKLSSSAEASKVGLDLRASRPGAAVSEKPPYLKAIAADEVFLSEALAQQLGSKVGDTILLRIRKPTQLSQDAPLSPTEGTAVAARVKVARILSGTEFGRYNLDATQVPPMSAFVSIEWLQQKVGAPGRANVLLADGSFAAPESLNSLLQKQWQLADAELELRPLTNSQGTLELRTSRVFLDRPVAEALRASTNVNARVLTYFVNNLTVKDHSTPFSMVSALDAASLQRASVSDLKEDEILISRWMADDLKASVGDELNMAYFTVGTMRKLVEQKARFTIRGIYEMSSQLADRSLMPDFPGMTDANSCRDWDAGFPIDSSRIRDKDEAYWKEFKGTPKAIINLAAGQKLWQNRFGDLTALRFAAGKDGSPSALSNRVSHELLARLTPASVGLSATPVRQLAEAASTQGQDFGQLFIGFSFFLMISALILLTLLFRFSIEQRSGEAGLFLALGFTPSRLRKLYLGEAFCLAVVGSLIGAAAAVAYAKLIIAGLTTIWRDAVAAAGLNYHGSAITIVAGVCISILVSLAAVWWTLRQEGKRPARELLSGNTESAQGENPTSVKHPWLAPAVGVVALGMVGVGFKMEGEEAAGMFFTGGGLLLTCGVLVWSAWVTRLNNRAGENPTLNELGLRNMARRRSRSRAVVLLLACGSFLVTSIGAFRIDSGDGAAKRNSGTGGFAWIGETAMPVTHDLNSKEGRDFYGISEASAKDIDVVPLRVRDGDEASCLNLNRAQRPRLLGVNPELLASRGAFSFAKTAVKTSDNPWKLLTHGRARPPGEPPRDGGFGETALPSQGEPDDDAIPAIGDAASIQWALGSKVGNTLEMTDERGQSFKIRIVGGVNNSILQGSLIISEEAFVSKFPGESGYRYLLVDAPADKPNAAIEALGKPLQDLGLELTSAPARLAAFNAVQNTYLSTFQVLGGLGLLLGSAGLAVVALRNILERKGELAIMRALGIGKGPLRTMILIEHTALLCWGLAIGVISGLVVILPVALAQREAMPGAQLWFTLLGVFAFGQITTLLAVGSALRGKVLELMR